MNSARRSNDVLETCACTDRLLSPVAQKPWCMVSEVLGRSIGTFPSHVHDTIRPRATAGVLVTHLCRLQICMW